MIPLKTQYLLVFNSIIFGMYLGITYDMLRFFRKNSYWFKVITDILFWVIQSGIASLFFYNISYGIIPIYLFMLFFMGYILYYYFFHDFLWGKLKNIKSNTKTVYVRTEKQRRFLLGADNYDIVRNFVKKVNKRRKERKKQKKLKKLQEKQKKKDSEDNK